MDDIDKQVRKVAREIMETDPLLVALGRAVAPMVNERLAEMERKKVAAEPVKYCPGCGEPSAWWPDLCPECLAVG